MKPEDIHLNDWHRIFIGDVPGMFYVEVLLRIAVIYLVLMTAMRLMGKRMASQLSRIEMVAMVALAASVGIPVMSPDRGLLPSLISAAVIVIGERVISSLAAKSQKAEALFVDHLDILVENSVLKLDTMLHCRVTRERLLAQLRSEGLYHLGSVKRLYLEANGNFSLVENPNPTPGLSVLPEWDTKFRSRQKVVYNRLVCSHCGNPSSTGSNTDACSNCGNQEWVPAVE
ncbi:MAG TPA: YetF domain-containing protein [Fibrella sp.]